MRGLADAIQQNITRALKRKSPSGTQHPFARLLFSTAMLQRSTDRSSNNDVGMLSIPNILAASVIDVPQ